MPSFKRILLLALAASTLTLPLSSGGQDRIPTTSRPEVQELIRTVQSADAGREARAQACRQLAVVGTPDAVPALAALLSNAELAHMARYALEPMPYPAVDEALRAALSTLQGPLLVGVIHSIGMRRDAGAVSLLQARLNDADAVVAGAAATALGRIGTTECALALTAQLTKVPADQRGRLADACLTCAERLAQVKQTMEALRLYDALRAADLPAWMHRAAVRGAILTGGNDGLTLLVEQLESQDPARVALALGVTRELPGASATKALTDTLPKLAEDTQVLLVLALADRGDRTALPSLLTAAGSGTTPTRVAALNALARLGDASTVPPLLTSSCDPNPEIAAAAQSSLAALEEPAVDAALITAVQSGSKETRVAAIEVLQARAAESAIPALDRATTDADTEVRHAALNALGTTVGVADLDLITRALVRAQTAEEVAAANSALSDAVVRLQGNPGVADKLVAVLPQTGPEARSLLMLQLADLGGPAALKAFRQGVQDSDETVRTSAIRALADWPDAAAMPDLAAVVQSTSDAGVRAIAFRGWVRLVRESTAPAEQRVNQLTQLAPLAADVQERRLVLAACGDVPDIGSLRLVASYLDQPALANEAGAAAVKLSQALGTSHKDELAPVLRQVLQSARSEIVLRNTREQMKKLGIPAG